jgi:adenylate kinase
MKNGAFVSDEVIVKLIDSELGKLGSEQGWLLDGFPRTMTQAQTLDHTLDNLNQPLNLVIHLNVPEEVILQRIMGKFAGADGCCGCDVRERKGHGRGEGKVNKKNRSRNKCQ